MSPSALAIATLILTLPQFPPDVTLSDAHRFGLTYEQTQIYRDLAYEDEKFWDAYLVGAQGIPSQMERAAEAKNYSNRACLIYWCLCIALSPYSDDDEKLDNLRELRERIGWEAYYMGVMPYPVPLYCYKEIRR
jgi:hypothetical protein